VKECQEILDEQDCPVYYRISTLLLFGACVEDVSDVAEYHREAKQLWQRARAHHSEDDVAANKSLEKLKVFTDSLRACIDKEVVEKGGYASSLMPEVEDPEELARIRRQMDEEQADEEDAMELEKAGGVVPGEAYDRVSRPLTAEQAAVEAAKLPGNLNEKLNLGSDEGMA